MSYPLLLDAIRQEQPQGVQLEWMPPGAPGSLGTTMERVAQAGLEGAHSPAIVLLARQITEGLPSHDEEGELRRIYEWIQRFVRYVKDPRGLEWVQTPALTAWVLGAGDCDDHSALVVALALALGHAAAVRMVATDPSREELEPSHVYALVGIAPRGEEPRWIACDTTTPEYLGWEPPPERTFRRWDRVVADL